MFAMAGALSWPAALLAENPPEDPFTKITDSPIVMESGVGMSWGDYDNDGFIDLYCGGTSQNLLFHNNGDGTFSKIVNTNAIVALAFARWNERLVTSAATAWENHSNHSNHSENYCSISTRVICKGPGKGR